MAAGDVRPRRPGWWFLPLLAIASACETGGPGGPDSWALTVRSPVAADVRVGAVRLRLEPWVESTLDLAEPPPWDVELLVEGQWTTVLGVEGGYLEAAGVVGGATPPPLPRVPIRISASGARTVALVADGFIRPGERVGQTDVWAFDVPRDATVATAVAIWVRGEQPRAIGLVELGTPLVLEEDAEALELELRPEHGTSQLLAVGPRASPAARVTAELTLRGAPTGVRLADGLVAPGDAIGLAVPAFEEALRPLGVRVRAIGSGQPGLVWDGHLRFTAAEHGFDWPAPVDLAPRPSETPDGALPLDRAGDTLIWNPRPGLLTVELRATDGCSQRTWRLVADAEVGRLLLPESAQSDILGAALIEGRATFGTIDGLSFRALLGRPAPVAPLVSWTAERTARALEGWWRVDDDACTDAGPPAGRYAVLDSGAACGIERVPPQVLVDACGRWIGLSGGLPADCGRFEGERLRLDGGFRWAWTVFDDGVVQVESPQPLDLVPYDNRSGLALPGWFAGSWNRAARSERDAVVRSDGEPGETIAGSRTSWSGGPDGPPKLAATGDGRVVIEAGGPRLEGRVESFDGREGTIRLLPVGCGLPTLAFDAGPAQIRATAVEPDPAAPGVVRETMWTFER
jgi:hypothetical protein